MTALSYVVGSSEPPLLNLSVGSLLDRAALLFGDRLALVVRHQSIRWTYAELAERVDKLARGFVAAGLLPGERIGIWSPNRAEWVLVQFAAAKAGLVLVNLNPAYRVAEIEYALRKVETSAIIAARTHKSSNYVNMIREIRGNLPALRLISVLGDDCGDDFIPFSTLARGASVCLPASPATSAAANIQFTSGTTGAPKGATLSHDNVVNNGLMVGNRIGLSSDDRVCIPVPLYHCFGMVMGNLACVAHGAAMVYPAEGFDPVATLSVVSAERCTALYGVPTMFVAMLEQESFSDYDLSSLRTGIMAGSPCPVAVMRSVMDRMNMKGVTIAYGMTETSPVSMQSDLDDPIELRVETVGKVQPHIEVKIINQSGRTLPRGEAGELCTRGYSVMLGYWADAGRTSEVIDASGWMHSGDLATIDNDGYCRIVGRIKDLVIRGGENIYPREIEEVILVHASIADAQVIGVPDDRYGEELCAWIILRAGCSMDADEVRCHVGERLAHFKVPRYVRFVAEFPLTATGKVQKFELRRIMIDLMESGDRQVQY